MSDKIYEYNGKYYSETDHSLEMDDAKWGGDLYDLYFDASHGDMNGYLCEATYYYDACNPENVYETYEELVEHVFEDCEISLEQMREQEKE